MTNKQVPPPSVPVGVKGLEWSEYNGHWTGRGLWYYRAGPFKETSQFSWSANGAGYSEGRLFATADAAKAAAQADYEQRIRSALEPAPSAPPSREEGLREALPDGFVRVDVGLTNQIINDTLERAAKAVTVASEQPIHSAEMRYVAGHRLGVDRSLAAIRALSHANGGE